MPGYAAQRLIPVVAVLVPAALGANLTDLGRVELLLAIGGLAGAIGPFGLDAGLVLTRSEYESPRRLVFATACIGAGLGAVTAWALGESRSALIWAGAVGAGFSGTSTAFAALRAARAHGRWNGTSLVWAGVCIVGTGIGAMVGHLAAFVSGSILLGALPAMAAARSTGRSVSLGYLLRKGLPVVAASVGAFWLAVGDRFFVDRFQGIEAVGQYGVAARLVTPATGFAGLFAVWWGAELFHHDTSWIAQRRARLRVTIMTSVGGATLGLCVLSIVGVNRALAGRELLLCEILLVAASACWALVYLSLSEAMLAHKTGFAALAFLLGASANVALDVLLIPRWSIDGAAGATLVGQAVVLGVSALRNRFGSSYQIDERAPLGNGGQRLQSSLLDL